MAVVTVMVVVVVVVVVVVAVVVVVVVVVMVVMVVMVVVVGDSEMVAMVGDSDMVPQRTRPCSPHSKYLSPRPPEAPSSHPPRSSSFGGGSQRNWRGMP